MDYFQTLTYFLYEDKHLQSLLKSFQKYSGISSFGATVEKWATEQGFSDDFFNKQPWEGKFLLIISSIVSNELLTKTGNQFETSKDLSILIKLVRNWVVSLKGSEARLHMTIRDMSQGYNI